MEEGVLGVGFMVVGVLRGEEGGSLSVERRWLVWGVCCSLLWGPWKEQAAWLLLAGWLWVRESEVMEKEV